MSGRAPKAALEVPEIPVDIPVDDTDDTLTTPQKLRGLIEDERAGFLPSTHREKIQAFAILDYLGNPQYPGGVHDYLAEIYTHNKGLRGVPRMGSLAVRSVLFEFSDYASAAIHDTAQLKTLQAVLTNTPNPHLSLAEAVADENQDSDVVTPFIKYIDVRGVATGAYAGAHDPLLTKEHRQPRGTGKNKVVHDTYDLEYRDLFMNGYLALRAETLTVGESRALVPVALHGQQRRQSFWGNVLVSRMYEYQHFADEALETLPE